MPEKITERELSEVIAFNMKEYATEVIVNRALPQAEDGLKPVTRRVLWAMHGLGLDAGPDGEAPRPYRKCARIVGDTMGKYHPHGDSSIYGALVTAAQTFRNSCPLIDGYGNFGTWDDGAAAMRYTEARLSAYGTALLAGTEKGSAELVPNFDGTEKEPGILPSPVPNLLINGDFGIAVGYQCSIPPHNAGEACLAMAAAAENPGITAAELMKIIKGPDFPSGGTAVPDGLEECYRTGKGKFIMRGTCETEELPGKKFALCVTSLPYGIKREAFIEKAAAVFSASFPEFCGAADESDRSGMRINFCFAESENISPEAAAETLSAKTPFESPFAYSFTAVKDGKQHVFSLKEYLTFLAERKSETVKKETEYDLAAAEKRITAASAKLLAGKHADEIPALIRKCASRAAAAEKIASEYKISQEAGFVIADMKLYAFAKDETAKLTEELKAAEKEAARCRGILSSPETITAELVRRLRNYAAEFGTPRRTAVKDTGRTFFTESTAGFSAVRAKGNRYEILSPDTKAKNVLKLRPADTVTSFLRDGSAVRFHGNSPRTEEASEILCMAADPAPGSEEAASYIFHVFRNGNVQKTDIAVWQKQKTGKIFRAAKEDAGDICAVLVLPGDTDVLLCTEKGMCIRFGTDEVRATGSGTGGMKGINLSDGDSVKEACICGKNCRTKKQKRGGNGQKQ